jgi:hypothetical protein
VTERRDRYGEPAQPNTPPPPPAHDPRCVNGWIPAGDMQAPCPVCKPWLAACPNCGKSRTRCEFDRSSHGRCCPACPHNPPRRRKETTR